MKRFHKINPKCLKQLIGFWFLVSSAGKNMSNIKELKRKTDRTDFAALILPDNMSAIQNAGCLYFEIKNTNFQKLKRLGENLLLNENDQEKNQLPLEAKASQFLCNLCLLNKEISDTEELVRLLLKTSFTAIPPIMTKAVFPILKEPTKVNWKIKIFIDTGQISFVLSGNGRNDQGAFNILTDKYLLEQFNPVQMKEDFYSVY